MSDALRLFLIEDDDNIATLIRKRLERVGHQVTRCRTAADALIVLSQSTFDLVLLDQRLPDMEGLDLLAKLAQDGIVAPVLMVTAWGSENLATQAMRAGALDYIAKDPGLAFLGELPKRVSESVRRHQLERANQLLIHALESAHDGVMITDLQGVIINVNRALENLTGYSRQELIGQNPRLLKSGVHPHEFYAGMWNTILARGSWQGEITNKHKDGSLRQVSMTISPIEDVQGRLMHFVGIQRDITERKQLERQLLQAQKMQSVGTLAGGIAHEFNNLLAGINGYAALGLREENVPATLREFMQNIVDLSERAASLTRQLLAFARKPALTRKRSSVLELLRSTAELVTRTLHQEVNLELPEPEQFPVAIVEADFNQLQQALINLALNGRDAMLERKGPVEDNKLTFRLRHARFQEERLGFPQPVPPGDWLVIEVRDRGVGMTPEVLNQALDPFFTTKEVGQGTGLGLPMVFGIVQGHQGAIQIESQPGVGTIVALFLPRMPEPKTPVVTERENTVMAPEQVARRSILVIDDEQAVLDVVRRFLKIAGHDVTCLTSGRAALEYLAGGVDVDLVVLDVMIPREDARATYQKIRQRRPQVPIVLCTGLAEVDPTPDLLRQEKTTLLNKPFRMNEMWYAVKLALEA